MNPSKINDESLEWVVALARWGGVLWLIVGFLMTALSVGVDAWSWAATGAVFLLGGGVLCWFGWWLYGNEEWRKPRPIVFGERSVCSAESHVQLEDGTFYLRQCSKTLGHAELDHRDDNPFLKEQTWR